MHFDEILSTAAAGESLSIPASWAQGRTVYGGLSAGLLCDAASRGIDGRRLRSVNVSFLRPLEPEKVFRIEIDELSAGRTVIVRAAHIVQDDKVRVRLQATFLKELKSDVSADVFEPPVLKHWNAEDALHMRGPASPAFTQHFDFYTTTDGLPFQGGRVPELGGWMRFDKAPDALTPAHLVCLIDAYPPSPSSYYDRPVPLSTVNWTVHMGEPLDGIRGDAFLGYLATVNVLKDGFGSSSADVWSDDGRLLAKSFQTFVIYG